eukprot:CAMPEP_0116892100 /NCGR_PEP_ID=MMETSP0467-20121206/2391_1 /TAXON_ID=283647 /ORGANISM="Mesodinium pulex, Strain SPMC105" /LENGTH=194 /DNA_ID=CAMNT_0004561027 /DNA_START=297 /DNA_END=881 /DNA_ORIENTATION=+
MTLHNSAIDKISEYLVEFNVVVMFAEIVDNGATAHFIPDDAAAHQQYALNEVVEQSITVAEEELVLAVDLELVVGYAHGEEQGHLAYEQPHVLTSVVQLQLVHQHAVHKGEAHDDQQHKVTLQEIQGVDPALHQDGEQTLQHVVLHDLHIVICVRFLLPVLLFGLQDLQQVQSFVFLLLWHPILVLEQHRKKLK